MNIARLKSEPEIFYSLQGEGARCGSPAVFLRLAGCNLACKWCDTKHSWGNGILCSVRDVAAHLAEYNCTSLVITGGEPLLQQGPLEKLLVLLPESLHSHPRPGAAGQPVECVAEAAALRQCGR